MDVKTAWELLATTIQNITDAAWVQITQYEASRHEVMVVGTSPFEIPALNQLRMLTDTLRSPLNPFYRSHHPGVNFQTRQVYLEGFVVRTTIERYLHGILDSELLATMGQVDSLRSVVAIPIKDSNGEIKGALVAYGGPGTLYSQLERLESLVALCRELLDHPGPKPTLDSIQKAARSGYTRCAERRAQQADMLDTVIQSRLSAATWRLNELLNDHELAPSIRGPIRESRDILSNLASDDLYKFSQTLYPSLLRIGLLPGISALINESPASSRIELSADDEVKMWDHPLHNRILWGVRLAAWNLVGLQLRALIATNCPDKIRVHVAIGHGCLWLQIQGDPNCPVIPAPHREDADQYVLVLRGTTYWSDHDTSLMAILPLTSQTIIAPALGSHQSPGTQPN